MAEDRRRQRLDSDGGGGRLTVTAGGQGLEGMDHDTEGCPSYTSARKGKCEGVTGTGKEGRVAPRRRWRGNGGGAEGARRRG